MLFGMTEAAEVALVGVLGTVLTMVVKDWIDRRRARDVKAVLTKTTAEQNVKLDEVKEEIKVNTAVTESVKTTVEDAAKESLGRSGENRRVPG